MTDQTTHTDSPFCCHGQHFTPKTVLEAAAWAVVREAPRELTETEAAVHAMLDAVRFALDASDDGGCGSDWRETVKARAAVAAVAAMRPDLAVITEKLATCLSNLDLHITMRAAGQAAEAIATTNAACRREVEAAQAETQRKADLVAEMGRHLRAIERQAEKSNQLRDEVKHCETILDAVRDLHKPLPGAMHEAEKVCRQCANPQNPYQPAVWPCSTAKALAATNGGKSRG